MNNGFDRFTSFVLERLAPEYQQGKFLDGLESFWKPTPFLFNEEEAELCVQAFELGLIRHIGGGLYAAPRSGAGEKFFNSGLKSESPRSFTLAQEAVITAATLARLHLHYGWPKDLIGPQSNDWAFDLVAYLPGCENEHIACEVKKSDREVSTLIDHLSEFSRNDAALLKGNIATGKVNSWRKYRALIARNIPFFWVVGPRGRQSLFSVNHENNGRAIFVPEADHILHYHADSNGSARGQPICLDKSAR